jgi:phage shock protein PspC (stress-responsive transcriptional regulator)
VKPTTREVRLTDQQTRAPQVDEEKARLRRSPDDKVVAGVCGGLGEYFGVDPVWFRVAFVALVFAGAGGGFILYLIAWIAVPERAADEAPATPAKHSGTVGSVIVGGVLIALGAIALLKIAVPWIDDLFWPGVLIAMGALLLWGGGSRDNRG